MTAFFEDPEMLAPARVQRAELPDGSVVLRSPEALGPYARCVGQWLEQWASDTPDALAFAQRDASGGWRRLRWRELRSAVGAVAQSLLALDLPAGKPLVILSDNAIDHAVLMLAAMHIGRPVCSVSSAYCRLTKDYTKIAGILRTLDPALVYASDARVYGRRLRRVRSMPSRSSAKAPTASPTRWISRPCSRPPKAPRCFARSTPSMPTTTPSTC